LLSLGSTVTVSLGGLHYGGILISVSGISRGQIFVLVFVGMCEAPRVGTWNLFTNTAFALGQRKVEQGLIRGPSGNILTSIQQPGTVTYCRREGGGKGRKMSEK